jgi:VanZ family protein
VARSLRLGLVWGPPILYMAAIFWMSSRSNPLPGLDLSGGRDKVAHAAAYAVLGLLLARAAFRSWPERGLVSMSALGAGLAAIYGVLDEVHQSFVPGRHATVGDVIADAVGAILGAGVFIALMRRRGLGPAKGRGGDSRGGTE